VIGLSSPAEPVPAGSPGGAGSPILYRLGSTLLRRKAWIAGLWVAIFAGGALLVGSTLGATKPSVFASGRESFTANARILETYGNGGTSTPIVPVLTLPEGKTVDSPGVRQELARAFARLQRRVPTVRIASYASTGDRGFVSADGRTTYALVFSPPPKDMHAPPAATDAVRRALAGERVGDASFTVGGLEVGKEKPDRETLSARVEGMVGGLVAFLILLLAFRSALAFVPIVTAVVSIVTSIALLWPVTHLTTTPSFVTFLMVLIGLGVSVDYSLLLVTRWREERDRGLDAEQAALRSVETAGRAVIVSGLTVAVGLLALVSLPVSFLRSIGYAGVLIPLVAIVVSLTLVPVVLASVGPALERLGLSESRPRSPSGDRWARWAAAVARRPLPATIAAVAVLVALIVPALSLNVRTPRAESLAYQGSARDGLAQLERSGLGAGALTPIEIVAPRAQADALASRLRDVPGVRTAVAPNTPSWRRRGLAAIAVVPKTDTNTNAGRELIKDVRKVTHSTPGALVGGTSASQSDFVSAVYGSFPLMLALIFIVTFFALARAFRSLVLPLKAIALNILSVAAALGAMVLVWQDGYGSGQLWDVPATASITEFVPLMTFAFLFGISMDYEVFILARMREEYDRHGTTTQAVVEGMRRTGRLVTLAGLILVFAFASLATSNDTNVNMFASGLAFGILIDATIIRMVLVPALVALVGRWNWWLPKWAARALRLQPAAEVAR
jgi:putative drug exporter of the RND superfamily